ncbi:hypothetical protein MLD38_002413 [Melastoma candidum]|uniref:Uncharacterized protein n=1 Tax=Melastoma candidum TaxID=119954 RepID=A0ACB9S2C0_9MYRT|nr:hypothetical protein MLD38_002413 [Melastoma candidum]
MNRNHVPCCRSSSSPSSSSEFCSFLWWSRVTVDNESSKKATLVKVDSANKRGRLLEVVQVLTDMNLIIRRAYISSDREWFMDVFHVTDQNGNKLS